MAPSYSFEVDKKPNKFVYAGGVFAGFFYGNFQRRRESIRILYRNQERRKTEYSIPIQILRHSSGTIIFLLLAFGLSLLGDWGIEKFSVVMSHIQTGWFQALVARFDFFTLPDRDFLKLILEICVGAISAILGLIFALGIVE